MMRRVQSQHPPPGRAVRIWPRFSHDSKHNVFSQRVNGELMQQDLPDEPTATASQQFGRKRREAALWLCACTCVWAPSAVRRATALH